MVMEVMRYRKWLIIGLLCISCVGLILLKPPISLVKTSPTQGINRINRARALDEQISAIDLSKATPHDAPLIKESLFSLLSDDKPQHQVARRTLVTDVEDYAVEVKKRYTIFYYAPSLITNSRQERIDSLRQELYDKNTTALRKQAVRKQLKDLLTSAEFVPFMHTVILYPLDSPQPHD